MKNKTLLLLFCLLLIGALIVGCGKKNVETTYNTDMTMEADTEESPDMIEETLDKKVVKDEETENDEEPVQSLNQLLSLKKGDYWHYHQRN